MPKRSLGTSSAEDGLPFVSCYAPKDVVGPKNLSLTVAGQLVYLAFD